MRYDRMIATILALPGNGETARTMVWRQLVDLIAQAGDRLDPDMRDAAQQRIATLGSDVSPADRRSAAASLATRADAQIVAIFGADAPAIAAPVLTRAQLDDGQWLALVPALPPASRTILRNRRDLSPAVVRALASFGPSDFALPPAEPAEPASQIRNLVERIETFRRQQPGQQLGQPQALPPTTGVDGENIQSTEAVLDSGFRFETDIDGQIDWIDGVPRAGMIGMSIAEAAAPRASGVDGQAPGAFRRRAPFHDARLTIAGRGSGNGEWLISAHPIFDPRSGRFVGYHGQGRRPLPGERARRFATAQTIPLAADSLRQLVHELRTPLNAIQGFAEMIEQQVLGPAAAAYRDEAHAIAGESRRLLEVVEDVDSAARLDSGRAEPVRDGVSDATAIVAEVVSTMTSALGERGVTLDARIERALVVTVGDAAFGRLAQRLLAMVTGLAGPGESIGVVLAGDGSAATLAVQRPRALNGVGEREMVDPGFGPDGEWPSGPLLGLGFSLRLIANLARAVDGHLVVGPDAFTLSVPRIGARDERVGEQG